MVEMVSRLIDEPLHKYVTQLAMHAMYFHHDPWLQIPNLDRAKKISIYREAYMMVNVMEVIMN